jgi:hypothetical protein
MITRLSFRAKRDKLLYDSVPSHSNVNPQHQVYIAMYSDHKTSLPHCTQYFDWLIDSWLIEGRCFNCSVHLVKKDKNMVINCGKVWIWKEMASISRCYSIRLETTTKISKPPQCKSRKKHLTELIRLKSD